MEKLCFPLSDENFWVLHDSEVIWTKHGKCPGKWESKTTCNISPCEQITHLMTTTKTLFGKWRKKEKLS